MLLYCCYSYEKSVGGAISAVLQWRIIEVKNGNDLKFKLKRKNPMKKEQNSHSSFYSDVQCH